jgi:restriction system protein
MTVPTYQALMLPLLKIAGDEAVHRLKDAVEKLAHQFELSNGETRETTPAGRNLLYSRVGFSKKYLIEARLLAATQIGHFQITTRGRRLLARHPQELSTHFLKRYPEFVNYLARSRKRLTKLTDQCEFMRVATAAHN